MQDQNWLPAKAVDGALESRGAIQYRNGDTFRIIYSEGDRSSLLDINLADKYQRRLVWLKTLGGRWVIDFDRANASNTSIRMFFCKKCGQPFDKLNDIGTHDRSVHNKAKAIADASQAEEDAEIEAKLLAEAEQKEKLEQSIANQQQATE